MESLVLETSTTNTITATSCDDSDDELGDFVYRTSLTARRLREEQQQALSTSSIQTTTRRKSSRLKDIKSREDKEKESTCSKPTTTSAANKTNTKRVIGSNKRKVSTAKICELIPATLKRVLRKDGKGYRTLCSYDGCTHIAQKKGGVCIRHGGRKSSRPKNIKSKPTEGSASCKSIPTSKRKAVEVSTDDEICHKVTGNIKRVRRKDGKGYRYLCSSDGYTNIAQKGGVCKRHGAKRRKCSHKGCSNYARREGVCAEHGAIVKKCSHKGCNNHAQKEGVCFRHGAKRKTCRHEGCNNNALQRGVCIKHGAVVKKTKWTCITEGCTKWARKEGLCTMHYNYKAL